MGRKLAGGFVLLLILGCAVGAWYTLAPKLLPARPADPKGDGSDAGRFSGDLRIAGDPWLGYYVLRSPHFKDLVWRGGLRYAWTDDKGNYAERMERLAKGDFDFIVSTVDAWLVNARDVKYPGVIVAVIDESHGGDAIIGGASVATLDDLAKPDVKIAVTPASPSDYLLKATAYHFNLDRLKKPGGWRVETSGSEEAMEKLKRGEVKAAVLWEPQVSQALKLPGCHKLTSTRDSANLIVDVLIARREIAKENPTLVKFVTKTYFSALHHYRSDPARAREQAGKDAAVDVDTAQAMLDGVQFFGLRDNARLWFGLGDEPGYQENRLALQVQDTIQILSDSGDLKQDPLGGDPFKILAAAAVESLKKSGWSPSGLAGEAETAGREELRPLKEEEWKRLRPVGHLATIPIYFGSGSDAVTPQDQVSLDGLARILRYYPDYRIVFTGHSSPGGDAEADRALSQARADAIGKYLAGTHHIGEARIRAVGVGADQPLPRKADESTRAWKARLARVEILLLEENY